MTHILLHNSNKISIYRIHNTLTQTQLPRHILSLPILKDLFLVFLNQF
uniref:Uncharacterized protein n=1 Tax=Podoviridae sp. ct8Lf7 TaxID=2827723 RepID=A0A8S5S0V9_9CAUD|nr:MAG TPA: hypothetical protein [Podoviridae sp. ct8Lf7]